MMGELERIADQLRRGLEGGAWHGPAVLELLAGVTAAQAHARPLPGARGIWELVLHLGGAYRLVLRRLRGDATQLAPDEDWPPVPEPSEANWTAAVAGLRSLNAEVRRAGVGFVPRPPHAPPLAGPPPPPLRGPAVLGVHPVRRADAARPLPRRADRTPEACPRGPWGLRAFSPAPFAN